MITPTKKRMSKIARQRLEMRRSVWRDLDERTLWHRHTSVGWVTVPRAMPLIQRIMDMLAPKGKPVSQTYFDLWCRTSDDSFVIVRKKGEMAYFSGFTGERAERTWASRMKELADLGFIEYRPGTSGEIHYVILPNPFDVIKMHHEQGRVPDGAFNALKERLLDVGSKDLDSDSLKSSKKQPGAKSAPKKRARRTARSKVG